MGFVLSVLYFIAYYLGPSVVFGPLANFRIMLILAVLIFVISLPKMMGSFLSDTPQSLALAGLSLTVFLSILIAVRWFAGAASAFIEFIPCVYAYFLICLHCDSIKKLKIIVFMLLFICLFVMAHGVFDLLHGIPAGSPEISSVNTRADIHLWNAQHPYVLPMRDDNGAWFYRIRGLAEINDPNDFAQLLAAVIPLLFFTWKPKRTFTNTLFILLPASILLYGIFLTHSRGGLLALVVVVVFASRRRFGTIPALVMAGAIFIGAMALRFTGGRAISAGSGSDRTNLWSQGLTMVKENPLFGVGFGRFGQYASNTAHNTIVVCAAEIGLVGLFCWSLFLFPTLRDVFLIASPTKVGEPVEEVQEKKHYSQRSVTADILDKGEVNRYGWAIALSLVGFLSAGWFLSRAFVMTLFMLGGMAESVYQMARKQGMVGPRLSMAQCLRYTLGFMVLSVTLVYAILRVLNLTR